MRPIGIEAQTAFGMPPVEYVALASELGCAHVSLGLGPMPWNPCNFAPWSLRDDAALRRELKQVMAATGVAISLAEGFAVRPQVEARDRVADMDILADLGAQRIGAVVMDRDSGRSLDQLATLADLAAERGMGFVLEFAPPHPVNNLAAALAAIRHLDRPNVGLVIDAMHLFRSGGTLADVACSCATCLRSPSARAIWQKQVTNAASPGKANSHWSSC
jgi:sugar phosphate isomerase/epimerase